MWGGKRQGAGRPKKGKSDARPQHQLRAYDSEWEIIKPFADLVKKGYIEECRKVLNELLKKISN